MNIAGHVFQNGRCTLINGDGNACGRAWNDIRNTVREEIGNKDIAHTGTLNEREYLEIEQRRNLENQVMADAMAAVAAGAGR